MSPVSRGRKPKKSKKRARVQPTGARWPSSLVEADRGARGSGLAAAVELLGQRARPAWFDPAIESVLDGAGALVTADGPRELEQLTAELLGAEMYRVLQGDPDGLWFAWWFEELIGAAAARVVEETDAPVRAAAFWLLHGLAAIGTPALASEASAACRRGRKLFDAGGLPDWLGDLLRVTSTGEVFRMRDAYGTRFAVVAGFTYGDGRQPSVFLFDIDASGFVKLTGAGVFDDVDQAAGAWRTAVGDTAAEATLQPVADPRELLCLVHCDIGEEMVMGDEPRVVMDNWFRAQRRRHDLAEALRRRGMPLPAAESLYHGLDTDAMTDEFTSWYADKHGTRPDPVALPELAAEWMEGTLPETWYAVSPARVKFLRELISDWVENDTVTLGVKSLLPDWVTWLGERGGLPEHLRARIDAAAR